MQITMTGRHLDVDNDLRDYAITKLRHLKKYSNNIIKVHAVLSQNRADYHAEVILRADHHRFFGEVRLPDARASIDGAIDKIERQLSRFKEKAQRKHKHELEPAHGPAELGLVPIEPVIDDLGEFEYEEFEPQQESSAT